MPTYQAKGIPEARLLGGQSYAQWHHTADMF